MDQGYELLYLIPAQINEEELPAITEKVKELIEAQGGIIEKNELWGKRKLAYPIKGCRLAYYWLVRYEAPAAANKKINTGLGLLTKITRHIISQPVAEPIPAEPKRDNRVSPKPFSEPARAASKTAASSDQKVSLEELDRKLDEILDQDVT